MSYKTSKKKSAKKVETSEDKAKRILKEINLVKNSSQYQTWQRAGQRINDIYKNKKSLDTFGNANRQSNILGVMFNVLWSNVQILLPSLFARIPKVVAERRFKDTDPIGRLAAQMIERATTFCLANQQDRYFYAVRAAVQDLLLAGCGQVWIRYDADFELVLGPDGLAVTDEDGCLTEVVKPQSEKVIIDCLNWQRYLHSFAANPFEIRWQAKLALMSRSDLKKRFGEKGSDIELNYNPTNYKTNQMSDEDKDFYNQAEVWEYWDLSTKTCYWVCEGYDDLLDEKKDPLRLNDFWPCPVPLLATTTTDSMIPTPDYEIYRALAEELDIISTRIGSIVECIKIVGAASAAYHADIQNIFSKRDGAIVPIKNWPQYTEAGGFKGIIDWAPFDAAVAALPALVQREQQLISNIYEVVGIPDIARGASDPSETLGAQQEKSRFMVAKIMDRQSMVQRFCREIASKTAEILFEEGLFSDETLYEMAGVPQMKPEDQQLAPQALMLARSDRLRTFRVDIETDSTIALDEEREKSARMEWMGAINQLISNVQNISQFRPELMSPMLESALFAANAFRTGRPLAAAWERAIQQIEDADEQAKQNPPQMPPDYESMKIQLEQQALQFRAQLEQMKLQQEDKKIMMDYEIKSKNTEIEGMKVMSKAEVEKLSQDLDTFRTQFDQVMAQRNFELEKYKVVMDEKEKAVEEVRLAKDAEIEQIKLAQQSQKIANETAGVEGRATGAAVNVHLNTDQPINLAHHEAPKAKKRVMRITTPDGRVLVGESMDIPDEIPVNNGGTTNVG